MRFADPSYGAGSNPSKQQYAGYGEGSNPSTQGGTPSPYGQTLAPVAATDTGVMNAAQPGPAVNPSHQWMANTQGAPAAPGQPAVYWNANGSFPASAGVPSYGQPYYGPPTFVFGWYGDGGWSYKLYSDNSIYATGSVNGTKYTDKQLTPGSQGHTATIEEWIRLNPAQLSTPIGQKFLQMRSAATPGLISTVTNALRDAAATVSGGLVAPSTAVPTAPQAPQMITQMVQTPQGPAMMQVPAPVAPNRGLVIAGGVLLALAAAGGAYYFLAADDSKKSE